MSQRKLDKTNEPTFQPGELREIVLKSIALGLFVGGAFVFPNLPIVIGSIIKVIEETKGFKVSEKKVKRVLKNLEKRELIDIEKRGNDILVHLKERRKDIFIKYSLKALLDLKKKKKEWMGKWYLVIFDVPEEQNNKRHYLRRFLRGLGFYPYQKSVYLFPYECKEEVDLIKQIVEGGRYIRYIVAERIDDEKAAKIFFGIV